MCVAASTLTLLAGRPAMAADAMNIDAVLPLTGAASFLGKSEQQALQILEETVNKSGGVHGQPVHFVFHDDQSSPQTAVQLASGIVPSHPPVVLGSAVVAMCKAMAPLMKSGPVMYCNSPGIHPDKGAFVFTSSVSTLDLAAAAINYLRDKGWTKVALITSTDASGQDAERGIKGVLARPANKSMKLVANVHFNPKDLSVAGQMEQVKSKHPDVLIAWSTGAPVATVFKGIVQAGLSVPVVTTNGNMTYAQMNQYASFLPKDLYIPSSAWTAHETGKADDPGVDKAQKEFFDAYAAKNIRPDAASTFAWDPGRIVISALQKLKAGATAADLRKYIAGLSGFAGINGVYDFVKVPQRGLNISQAVMTRWDPAKKVWAVVSKAAGVPIGG
jgi:branched-chain amino acid transport system substrate-binding protein